MPCQLTVCWENTFDSHLNKPTQPNPTQTNPNPNPNPNPTPTPTPTPNPTNQPTNQPNPNQPTNQQAMLKLHDWRGKELRVATWGNGSSIGLTGTGLTGTGLRGSGAAGDAQCRGGGRGWRQGRRQGRRHRSSWHHWVAGCEAGEKPTWVVWVVCFFWITTWIQTVLIAIGLVRNFEWCRIEKRKLGKGASTSMKTTLKFIQHLFYSTCCCPGHWVCTVSAVDVGKVTTGWMKPNQISS